MTWLDRHLDEQALLLFHYHQLEPETHQRLASHLEECVSCRQELDHLGEILVQSSPPDLEVRVAGQGNFWARMRRRRRLRRLRRGMLVLALIVAAALLLVARYPAWNPLPRLFPAGQQPPRVAPVETVENFDLPQGSGWLQRYLPEAPADDSNPSD